MKNLFNKLTKSLAQSVTRRAALKRFGVGLASMALAASLAPPCAAADPSAQTSVVLDPAGDAEFSYDFYGAPVPPYLDIVRASVTLTHGKFHFEVQMSADIPAMADPVFTPSVNHLGCAFGLLTDPATAVSKLHWFGQPDHYAFNFFVGALYAVGDSGLGLGLGWHAFLSDFSASTTVEIPLQIKNDTLIFETSAASLGNPTSFGWVVAAECDPVLIGQEERKSIFLVDWVPDHDYASWPAQ
jgi:hypothetical protein